MSLETSYNNLLSEVQELRAANANMEKLCDKRQKTLVELKTELSDMRDYSAQQTVKMVELDADCKAMAKAVLKEHGDINCGNNTAMDYIRHGTIIKVCPACLIAAKYREGNL